MELVAEEDVTIEKSSNSEKTDVRNEETVTENIQLKKEPLISVTPPVNQSVSHSNNLNLETLQSKSSNTFSLDSFIQTKNIEKENKKILLDDINLFSQTPLNKNSLKLGVLNDVADEIKNKTISIKHNIHAQLNNPLLSDSKITYGE